MEAAKALGAFSLFPGYKQSQNDAVSAYTQSFTNGIPTYVRLPKNRWPKHWVGKYVDPVAPLILALYGHPDSGGYWEKHCDERLKRCGWTPMSDSGWRSCYYHEEKKAFLIVYVDAFKMASPEDIMMNSGKNCESR